MNTLMVVVAVLVFPINQNADANSSTTDDDFLLYGRVDVPADLQNSFVCTPVLAVEIGNHKWRQQLKWKTYAFRASQSMFGFQMTGVLSLDLYRHHKFIRNLWTRHFVVEGSLRVDINIDDSAHEDCDCGQAPSLKGKEQDPDPEYSHIKAYPLALVLSGEALDMARPVSSHNGMVCRYQFACHRELPVLLSLPGSSMEARPHLTSLWRFLILAFAAARLMTHLVPRIVKTNKVRKSVVEGGRGGQSKQRKRWEISPLRGTGVEKKKVVLLSGEGTYEEAWADAEHHLGKMGMQCCFYFNCGEMNKLHSEGQWNRDRFGRLIRQ